jgi:TBC1 domain family member 13
VDPQFYAFRWITLLLSQEFPLTATLRIWDALLGDPTGRSDCLLRICTAMLLHVRPQLMQADFTRIMQTLQRYPPVDVNDLLCRAATLPSVEEAVAAAHAG